MSVLLALLVDALFGEPPNRLHPVAWIGRALGWAGRRLPSLSPAPAFAAGATLWLLGAVVFVAPFAVAAQALHAAPAWLAIAATGLLLKPLVALRGLVGEVQAVENALAVELDVGRRRLSRIVSRDTARLTAGEVRESALESLSENLSDSVVAPLLWFAVLGLPGAALYRFANTADAMWGYRGPWEWAGKWAARTDDLLNLIPARLTALLLLALTPRRIGALRRLHREAARTPSPNSGWPMAALALSHGIRLGKPGVYALNPRGASPAPDTTPACIRHVRHTAWAAAFLLAAAAVLIARRCHA